MKRRDHIKLTDDERDEFLSGNLNCTLATIDANGFPHLTAMWYALIDGKFHFATYAKSQKVINLQQNPKCSVLVEDGDTYSTLRGYTVQGRADIVQDAELAGDVLIETSKRYAGLDVGAAGESVEKVIRERGAKRSVIIVQPEKVMSWDHRKLGGTY